MNVDDVIQALSGFKHACVKRKTSYFNINIDMWIDPEDRMNFLNLKSIIHQQIDSQNFSCVVRLSEDSLIINSSEIQITVYKQGKIEYGERLKLFD